MIRVENTVGKGENAGNQHFLLFPQCFPKPPFLGSLKVDIVWQRVNLHIMFILLQTLYKPTSRYSEQKWKCYTYILAQQDVFVKH